MNEIDAENIIRTVKDLCIASNYTLGDDVLDALKAARDREDSPVAKDILDQLVANAETAAEGIYPLCQDTGLAVVFVERGEDVRILGGDLINVVTEGVRQGYQEGYLRKSIVKDPLRRENTNDNTPPVIWTEVVPGDQLKITLAPKGGGSENMSALRMLKPSDGIKGVKEFIIDTIRKAGGNPCPPVVVGVGLGGSFERCAFLAKRSLLRRVGERHQDPFYAHLEVELLDEINQTGIGPMGIGGKTTALDVHIEYAPCHIASLPVAVNMQCHSARHKSAIL